MCRQKKKKQQQKTEMLYFTMNAEGASMRHLTSNLGKMFFEKNPTDFIRPYIMYDFNTYVTNTAIGPCRRNSVMILCDRNWKVNGIEQREAGEKNGAAWQPEKVGLQGVRSSTFGRKERLQSAALV